MTMDLTPVAGIIASVAVFTATDSLVLSAIGMVVGGALWHYSPLPNSNDPRVADRVMYWGWRK